ncbi:MAG: formate dehydrogenase accessory protein FdhE [Desulfobacterales bacterium]|jgi:FdhE protein|nr:formate dehydrogenase accessory protein FdhE [Desulfobacterales bacterium]
MQPSPEYTPATVRQAAAGIIAERPSYRELITFYGRIFAAQEAARPRIRLDPVHLPQELIRIKRQEQMPLVLASQLNLDPQASAALLRELCRIAIECGSELAGAGRILSERSERAAALFIPFAKAQEPQVLAGAGEMDVDPESLAFFLYHSLRPSFCSCAAQLARYLEPTPSGEQGYCPVCGSAPAIAWIEAEGRRCFFCSYCWHKWPVNRALCPFCGNRGEEGLLYFYSEEEKEYRLDACSSCRRYVKAVDARALRRPGYPALEQVASLHLDLKAVEAGYTAAAPARPTTGPDGP